MLLGMLSISLHRSHKGFGYALGIDAAPEAIRPRKNRMYGGYEPWEFFLELVFLLLARESTSEKGAYVEVKGHVSRSIEEWEEDFAGVYICLYR